MDVVLYGAQLAAISEGRVPDGSPTIYPLENKGTPGRSNWVDSNGDGLPDAWELANGLDPFAKNNSMLDPDGDGLTNLQEYLSGTDPNRAESKLRLESANVTTGDGGFVIRFTAEPGKSYVDQFRDSVPGAGWVKFQDFPAEVARQVIEVVDSEVYHNAA